MPALALLSILCRDRVGLVSAVADHLFGIGVNLGDATFAVLGGGAEFTAVCELPEGVAPQDLEEGLRKLPELEAAQIRAVPYAFEPVLGPLGRITHRIEVSGGDQLGLIARLSEIFARYGANIVRLEAQKLPEAQGSRYVTRFAVSIPSEQAEICLASVANTAGSLGLESRAEAVADGTA